MHRQTAFAVVLIFLLAPPAGAAELTVTAGDRVHAGDVVHVRGKGAFARGTRYSFFVGGAYASWRRLDDDTGVLVVPAGAAQGRQWLSYTPRLTGDATGATGIARIDVQPERRETVAAKTVRFSNEHSAVATGAMRIEGRAIDRPARITLRQLRSDSETAFFRSTIVAGFDRPEPPLPPLSFDDVFSIEAAGDARVTALSVAVPAESAPSPTRTSRRRIRRRRTGRASPRAAAGRCSSTRRTDAAPATRTCFPARSWSRRATRSWADRRSSAPPTPRAA